jgi:hypothetical protein
MVTGFGELGIYRQNVLGVGPEEDEQTDMKFIAETF